MVMANMDFLKPRKICYLHGAKHWIGDFLAARSSRSTGLIESGERAQQSNPPRLRCRRSNWRIHGLDRLRFRKIPFSKDALEEDQSQYRPHEAIHCRERGRLASCDFRRFFHDASHVLYNLRGRPFPGCARHFPGGADRVRSSEKGIDCGIHACQCLVYFGQLSSNDMLTRENGERDREMSTPLVGRYCPDLVLRRPPSPHGVRCLLVIPGGKASGRTLDGECHQQGSSVRIQVNPKGIAAGDRAV
jgi:hypothetical protein